MANHEYKIYVEVVYQIFQKCFEMAELNPEERGWPKDLNEAINAEFASENHLDQKSIRDLYNAILRLKKKGSTLQETTISERTLDILSRFATIENYKQFNSLFKGIAAVYTPKPYGRFNLLRIFKEGVLVKSETGWYFESADGIVLQNITVTKADNYGMDGDRFTWWVKVTFGNETEKEANYGYFAQIHPAKPVVTFLNTKELLNFFQSCTEIVS